MDATNTIFNVAILIMSIVIHEVSHGFMAEYFGDSTARDAGRLTLNPIKHLDPFGSVILPIALFLLHSSFFFGWAKPVPYNPNNLSNKKWGTVAVAGAGILANLFIAFIFGMLIKFAPSLGFAVYDPYAPIAFYRITSTIVILNLALAIFNLIPIAPLDGSKILFSFLPDSARTFVAIYEQYSIFLLLIFVFFFSSYLTPILLYLFSIFTGIAF